MSEDLTPASFPAPDPARWMRVAAYAKACGLTSPTGITERIRRGTLPAVDQVLLDGTVVQFIDAVAHPPQKRAAGRTPRRPSAKVPARARLTPRPSTPS